MHAKGFFLTTLKQGFAQELKDEKESYKVERGVFKPSQKRVGPLRHRLHFLTLSQNFSLGVFPVEVATLSPRWL